MIDHRSSSFWGRAETDLIYTACAVGDRSSKVDGLRTLVARQDIDWDYLYLIAQINRIVPVLHDGLAAIDYDGVPEAFGTKLDHFARAIKVRALVMTQELVNIIALFQHHGIESMPLKGPVLAAQFYGNPTGRHYHDLDLLVGREDIASAKALLLERGYELRYAMTPAQELAHLTQDCQLEFECRPKHLRMELHWDALPARQSQRFNLASLQEHVFSLSGAALRTFVPEDHLLYVCVHGGEKHMWVRLQCLCDVAHILASQPDLDWQRLERRASEVGRHKTVLLGVFLAWLLLDAPVPRAVIEQALADPRILAQAGLVHGRLFKIPSSMPSYREWCRELKAAERVLAKRGFECRVRTGFLRYLRSILTPEWTDRQTLQVPRYLSFLHYAYRPLRLLRKHRAGALRRI